ncbi:MAG: outer membrane lipoprotein carrier protein LolA [Odoribacteraceae bacterium]|jgi:outer membrane lipoprotein-sorting protein|nr:outer membrane lipoprotein carrier protein LolA [Odoribacteraceae bacterium]
MNRTFHACALACCLLAWGNAPVGAQTASRAGTLLDNVVNKIKSYPAVEVIFTLTMENKAENVRESYPGKAYMKGNMYRVEVMDAINYFDGEAIYTYMPEVEEVTIKDPGEEQEELLDPTILFDIHNREFTRELLEEKGGKARVALTPKKPGQIRTIDVWIDTATNAVERVTSFGNDGNDVSVLITSLKPPGQTPNDAFFRFDAKAHPGVEVIDLR